MSTTGRVPTEGGPGPRELVLATEVARRHYVLGEAKTDIAETLGISRFKVARLIDLALGAGIVQISITPPDSLDTETSARLRDHLGLEHVLVTPGPTPAAAPAVREALARLAADLLQELLREGDVLGLPWSRTVSVLPGLLHDLPPVDVVQLTGALQVPGVDSSAVSIARESARVTGGRATLFFAPFVLEDAAAARAVLRQSEVRTAIADRSRVTHAVVGLGAWGAGTSTIHDAVSAQERRKVREAGVVGEIAGVLFDAHGRSVTSPLADRLISVSVAELVAIPEVIAVCSGSERATAVRAAVEGGLVTGLLCDFALAEELLR
ncbi:sugar-binding domain-containing protein [Janibacter sp. DB-40]|uniref:sugar-binding transcriptional regulator n=1 Tax=Janibacter sp. DB-40 TaxID=3028808 RepID=UPI002406F489|nr:sugar-binding domain-containing protein [Janibacter sp. DB-40]